MEKILGMGFTMVLGGNDTATGLLGGACEYLTAFPEQRAKLIADPSLRKTATEEFLRLSTPVQGLARTATKDVTLHDVTIPEGRKVMLMYASAPKRQPASGR